MSNYLLFMGAIALTILVFILLSFLSIVVIRALLSLKQRKAFDDVIKKINNNSL